MGQEGEDLPDEPAPSSQDAPDAQAIPGETRDTAGRGGDPGGAVAAAGTELPADTADGAPPLQLHCFGPVLRVTWRGRELAVDKSPLTAALLAYLAISPPAPVSRDTLVAALYAEEEQENGRGRLRKVLMRARDLLVEQAPDLPPDLFVSQNGGLVALNARLAGSDVQRFRECCALASLKARPVPPLVRALAAVREAAVLFQLPEYHGRPGSGQLAEPPLLRECGYPWLDSVDRGGRLADQLRRLLFDAIRHVAARCAAEGRPGDAIALYQLLVDEDPSDEAAILKLLDLYGRAGDRQAVRRLDRQLRAALKAWCFDGLTPAEQAAIDPADYAPSPSIQRAVADILARPTTESRQEASGKAAD